MDHSYCAVSALGVPTAGGGLEGKLGASPRDLRRRYEILPWIVHSALQMATKGFSSQVGTEKGPYIPNGLVCPAWRDPDAEDDCNGHGGEQDERERADFEEEEEQVGEVPSFSDGTFMTDGEMEMDIEISWELRRDSTTRTRTFS
jgi:hypothetical protein